jgi:hypothetical protein
MKTAVIRRRLRDQGCSMRQGKGDHERWTCPCGKHKTALVQDTENSPGVVSQIIKDMACLPKGWLQ